MSDFIVLATPDVECDDYKQASPLIRPSIDAALHAAMLGLQNTRSSDKFFAMTQADAANCEAAIEGVAGWIATDIGCASLDTNTGATSTNQARWRPTNDGGHEATAIIVPDTPPQSGGWTDKVSTQVQNVQYHGTIYVYLRACEVTT